MLSGTVEALLFVGDRQEVDVKLRDNTRILIYAPRWASLQEAQAVHLKVRDDSMTIWPGSCGKRSPLATEGGALPSRRLTA